MDEERLREMLRNATNDEPPIGPIVLNALRAGIRLRRRRRIQAASTCAAAVLAVGIAGPAVLGAHGHSGSGGHRHGQVLYVIGTTSNDNGVTPIPVATGRAGRPIRLPGIPQGAVLSPDGKTLYVAIDQLHPALIPISTRSGKQGSPITAGGKQPGLPWPLSNAITPNGKTIYLLNVTGGFVTPVNLVTGKAGRQIRVGQNPRAIAVDPNGRTAYVLVTGAGQTHGKVLPLNLRTNKLGKAIRVGKHPLNIVITPDGKTAYVSAGREVWPIDTASNKAGRPITVGHVAGSVSDLAITPNGRTVLAFYGESFDGSQSTTLTPISASTNRVGRALLLSSEEYGVAFAPDSKTAYLVLSSGVVPWRIATTTLGKPIGFPGGPGASPVLTANGKTLYVLAGLPPAAPVARVFPIRTTTKTAGKPIRVGPARSDPIDLVIAP
jgi:DNA-binding beta-propeller fold protein YncE